MSPRWNVLLRWMRRTLGLAVLVVAAASLLQGARLLHAFDPVEAVLALGLALALLALGLAALREELAE